MVSWLLMPNDWLLLYSPQTLVASTETGVEANSQSVAVRSVQAKMGVFTVPSVGALGKCSSLWTEGQNSTIVCLVKFSLDFMWSRQKDCCATHDFPEVCAKFSCFTLLCHTLPALFWSHCSLHRGREPTVTSHWRAGQDGCWARKYKRDKLELEEYLREYQARCIIALNRRIPMTVCMRYATACFNKITCICLQCTKPVITPLYSNCCWRPM